VRRGGHAADSDTPPPASDEDVTPGPGQRADLPVLEVSGELDLAVAPWLRDQIDALFVGGASSLILDLSEATFLDSTALGVLVGALNRCKELGGHLDLVVTEPQILRVLSITGLGGEFALHQSRADVLGGRTEQ